MLVLCCDALCTLCCGAHMERVKFFSVKVGVWDLQFVMCFCIKAGVDMHLNADVLSADYF